VFFLSYCSDEGLIFEEYGLQFHVQNVGKAESFVAALTSGPISALVHCPIWGLCPLILGGGGGGGAG
jgi:hypothetical protein